ncbi:MAG: hypothetical protein ABIO04_09570 [Ferruginibacter sp.]
MKLFLLISILLVSLASVGQETFSKVIAKTDSTLYQIKDLVEVKNGRDEAKQVQFTGSFPRVKWDAYLKQTAMDDKRAFSFIARTLTIKAKYELKNIMSFQPMQNQFISVVDDKFNCNFKMTGINDIGNLVEESKVIQYDPYKPKE